ncbi:DUF3048 domain-containing protein [Parageobacillus thermoglucosidasius]|uniref:DUF3048 domain-containing protein n=1 Tax=Parageobacillus thermoglucosidasius TaxID=1426 RepID=A0AB38QZ82_PARTM|nr:DUF3048 domain-containing protein [Parageobacillus thermoglucosidasius]UOE76634.1 DUF3048 domain-containing protein [Parageobacillus thermoglucosidasius]
MKRCLIAMSAACLFIGGCMHENKQQAPEPKPGATETPKQQEAPNYSHVFPLTGLPAKEAVNRRVIAIMVNNHPKARPQSGLQKADIVYEVLAEGDITRFLALYQSEFPEKVGPVRSARDYYVELSNGYHALYVCHGWSPEAKAILEAGASDYLNGLFYDGTLFQRVPFRKAPHNSYITFANIEKGAAMEGYSLQDNVAPLPFRADAPQGEKAGQIDIIYSHRSYAQVRYKYVADQKCYFRYSAGEQTVDYDTREPVKIQNVLVVAAKHSVIDSAGRRSIDLSSSGNGYLFQNGIIKQVEWKNVDGRILPYERGVPVGLVPGKTWINVVPDLDIVKW